MATIQMRHVGRRRCPTMRPGLLLVSALSGAFGTSVRAQEQPLPPLSFVFARHAGSGIYSVEDRPVQIYNLPFSIPVRSLEQRRWGLKVTLPVTVGFFDFRNADVLETGLPEHVGTLSLIPGLRFDVAVTGRWTLSPFAELGAAKDLEAGNVVTVSGLGVLSEWRPPLGSLDGRLAHRVLAAGSRDQETGDSESYGELRTGFELGVPLNTSIRGQETVVAGFVSNYLYYRPPDDFLAPMVLSAGDEVRIRLQWEAGVTFGTRQPSKLWKVPLPRIGLSYRFGDGPETVRLVLGSPF